MTAGKKKQVVRPLEEIRAAGERARAEFAAMMSVGELRALLRRYPRGARVVVVSERRPTEGAWADAPDFVETIDDRVGGVTSGEAGPEEWVYLFTEGARKHMCCGGDDAKHAAHSTAQVAEAARREREAS